MKKTPYILLLAAALLSACGGDNPEPLGPASADLLRLQPRDVSIKASQQAAAFQIEANCDWTITPVSSWDQLLVSPLQGSGTQDVTISTPANPYNTDRQAQFRVTTSDGIATLVTLTQAAGEVVLQLSDSKLSFRALREGKTITVQSNVEWTVTSSDKWAEAKPDSGRYDQEITVTCEPNTSEEAREATISFWYEGELKQQLALRQLGGTRPAIDHVAVTDVGRASATVSFVCSASDFPVKECGVWYGTDSNPRENGKKLVAQADANGNVVVKLEGLTSATDYRVVPYAINDVGEVVAEVQQFQTRAIPDKDDNTPPKE